MNITYRIESEDEARALFAIFNKNSVNTDNPVPKIFYIGDFNQYITNEVTYQDYYFNNQERTNPRYISVFANADIRYCRFNPFDITLTEEQLQSLQSKVKDYEHARLLNSNIIAKIHSCYTPIVKDEDIVTVQLTRVQAEALAKSLSTKYPSDFERDVIKGKAPHTIKNLILKDRFDKVDVHAVPSPKGKAHLHDIYDSIVKALDYENIKN